jgi:glutamine amidotransferase-like uncharacterized protein
MNAFRNLLPRSGFNSARTLALPLFYLANLSACNSYAGTEAALVQNNVQKQNTAQTPSLATQPDVKTPSPEATASTPRAIKADALIFDGTAVAYGSIEAITSILDTHGSTYRIVSSSEIDSMSLDEISQYGIIIWPGGYAGQMSASLRSSTRETLRKAVNDRGVGFVGICAGAFIAVSPPKTEQAQGPKWGLSVLPADDLLPYYHLEDEGTEDAMVKVDFADGSSRSLVWWGGPYLPEYPKGVVARYNDTHQPAIIQTWAGKGLVVLSGPHPEAPNNWRTKLGLNDKDGLDQDIAWKLFETAMKQQLMPVMN